MLFTRKFVSPLFSGSPQRSLAVLISVVGIATAAGLLGTRVEKPGDLEDALRAAFAHDGPPLIDVQVARQEPALPPQPGKD